MAIIQLRVDDELKLEATSIYQQLGLDLSSAIRMFLKRSVMVKGIPFPTTIENVCYDREVALKAMKVINDSAEESGSSKMNLKKSLVMIS